MITNSSPLITFGKINKLDFLCNLFDKIIISQSVYSEVVEEGLQSQKPEANLIKEFIDEGKIKVKQLNQNAKNTSVKIMKSNPKLDKGEADTISLAIEEKEKRAIIDEKIARKVAELYGVYPIGSLGIILIGYKKKMINEKEVKEIITKIINGDFRIGAEVLNEFWLLFEKVKKEK